MKPNFTCNLCGKLIYSSTELDSHICANLVDGNEPIHIYKTATNEDGHKKEEGLNTKVPIHFVPAKDRQEIERDEPTIMANKEERPEQLDLSASTVVSPKDNDKQFCHKEANDKVSDGNPRQFDKERWVFKISSIAIMRFVLFALYFTSNAINMNSHNAKQSETFQRFAR